MLGSTSARKGASEAQLCSISPERQRLLRLMQQIGFGTIQDLQIRWREPIFAPPPRVIRRIKIGGKNVPHRAATAADFALKSEVVEFFEGLDGIQNGILRKIEVCNGLPMVYDLEQPIPN